MQLKEKIETAIHTHHGYSPSDISGVTQLKSGDVRITAKDEATARKIRESTEWLKIFGAGAKAVEKSYGIIIDDVRIQETDGLSWEQLSRRLEAENERNVPGIKIKHGCWLRARLATTQKSASAVIQLASKEHANYIIDNGLMFGARLLGCQKYDEKCRLRQCFKCYQYRHTWKQCTEKIQLCGYCAGPHNLNECPKTNVTPREAPKCPACGGSHVSWSTSCPKRQEEMARVKLAHMNRTKYHDAEPHPGLVQREMTTPMGSVRTLSSQEMRPPPGYPATRMAPTTQPLQRRPSVTKLSKSRKDPVSVYEDRGPTEDPDQVTQLMSTSVTGNQVPESSQEITYHGMELQLANENDENEGWTEATRKSTRKRRQSQRSRSPEMSRGRAGQRGGARQLTERSSQRTTLRKITGNSQLAITNGS